MAKRLFSVTIFLLVFRETLEAAIIISVLLGLVEQIVFHGGPDSVSSSTVAASEEVPPHTDGQNADGGDDSNVEAPPRSGSDSQNAGHEATGDCEDDEQALQQRALLKKLRIQIFLGSGIGFFIALSVGAAFIAVWFTKGSDLWKRSEALWEGVFSLVASAIIFVMGVTMLKMDRAKVEWKIKLRHAYEGRKVDGRTNTGKWVLFFLPFITVLREAMEGIVFVGGISLAQPATAIPIAAITGIICGLIIGYIIYKFASRTTMAVFMVVMTNLILLIGAGLFSKGVAQIEGYDFGKSLRGSLDKARTGAGSYDVRVNIWHLNCCSPSRGGWLIFNSILGWSNNGTYGSVFGYVAYWVAVIIAIAAAKWKEGRVNIFGFEYAAAAKRRAALQTNEMADVPANETEARLLE